METDLIMIRPATEQDTKALLEVHYDAVQNIASADYSKEIISQWSQPVDRKRIEEFLQNPENEIRLVAELKGYIVGFGALVLEQNELRACYVSARAARKGVGQALLNKIEYIARINDLDYLQLDSSLTAEKFYLHCGYQVIGCGKHTLNNGMTMDCVRMRKNLQE